MKAMRIIVFGFLLQGCTETIREQSSSSDTSVYHAAGNGTGYGGKTYVNYPAAGACADGYLAKNRIRVVSAATAYYDRYNCQATSPQYIDLTSNGVGFDGEGTVLTVGGEEHFVTDTPDATATVPGGKTAVQEEVQETPQEAPQQSPPQQPMGQWVFGYTTWPYSATTCPSDSPQGKACSLNGGSCMARGAVTDFNGTPVTAINIYFCQ